jgi:EAL domain-containing protein (putative c-di-GMP-specific phosphodiesterase class I)
VEATIEALRLNPEVRLGCDISIDSAVIDGHWASINVQLQRSPELASRLVLEITGSAAPPNFEAACQFVHYVHSLGCAVAFDDVVAGAGSTGLTPLIERSANSARIQAGYVRRASSDDKAPVRLRRLMRRVMSHTN